MAKSHVDSSWQDQGNRIVTDCLLSSTDGSMYKAGPTTLNNRRPALTSFRVDESDEALLATIDHWVELLAQERYRDDFRARSFS